MDLKYLAALNCYTKFGPVRFKKLKAFFPSWKEAFSAAPDELIKAGIDEKYAFGFISERKNLNPDAIMERISKENINLVSLEHPQYPELLKEIPDAPPLLYVRGELKTADKFALAVVGARKFTAYGQRTADEISGRLAGAGVTIISGLALGIDGIAHEAALSAGGRTLAVLGSGVNKLNVYPTANRLLSEKIIASGGALISEFPPDTLPFKAHFPQRNRIIAGLARAVLVIEAGEKSGSLITARFGLDFNREVMAVPGSIYSPVSAGVNALIKNGAILIRNADDVLEALDLAGVSLYIDTNAELAETSEEKLILSLLGREGIHVNDLIRVSKLPAAAVSSALTIMEMKGLIKNLGGMEYALR